MNMSSKIGGAMCALACVIGVATAFAAPQIALAPFGTKTAVASSPIGTGVLPVPATASIAAPAPKAAAVPAGNLSPAPQSLISSASSMADEFAGSAFAGDELPKELAEWRPSEVTASGPANANDESEADEDDYAPTGSAMDSAAPAPSSSALVAKTSDLKTAAGYHYPSSQPSGHNYGGHGHGHYGKYYQYASVPYPYAWEFGYRRGNPYHTIERHEHGKGSHFKTKVRWHDKGDHYNKGESYGVHVWDYNHDDHTPHYHKHSYDGGHHDGYKSGHKHY